MVEMALGWMALFVGVAVLAVLGLLADEWGVESRDDFGAVVIRGECH